MNWKTLIEIEKQQDYFKELQKKLGFEYKNYIIYPPQELILQAFKLTPFDKVKVVLVAQDPYINDGQAMGLSFSVPKDKPMPPSLINIFKEINSDMGAKPPMHGDLTGWAKQGVLLLNSVLTVRSGDSNSHAKIGWEIFTDSMIKQISHHKKHVVFMLWGNHAKDKLSIIRNTRHGRDNCTLTAAHPSPFSARNGFFGCKHFSKANEYLIKTNQEPIDWLKTT